MSSYTSREGLRVMALHRLKDRVRSFAEQRLASGGQTPFIVIDLDEVVRAHQAFTQALPRVTPYYAVKANPDRPLVKVLRDLGSNFDVASLGEIRYLTEPGNVAVHGERGLGVDPKRLIFANPVKRPHDIAEALKTGVRLFTADCVEELDKIHGVARQFPGEVIPEILVRIWVPNFGSMIDLSSKFGAEADEAREMYEHAKSKKLKLKLRGLAFHVGSQCINPTNYTKAVDIALKRITTLKAAGFTVDTLDIGGGFPVNYTLQVSYVNDVMDAVKAGVARIPKEIRVIAEPGRMFCATSATLFTQIIGRTVKNGRPWYFIDDSIYHTFSGKVYDYMDYQFYPFGRAAVPGTEVVVAGCSCDGHDIISKQALLPPDLPVGTLLYAPNIGAYTSASASSFNGFQPAARLHLDPTLAVKPRLAPAEASR